VGDGLAVPSDDEGELVTTSMYALYLMSLWICAPEFFHARTLVHWIEDSAPAILAPKFLAPAPFADLPALREAED
jgi:hypothetical protein